MECVSRGAGRPCVRCARLKKPCLPLPGPALAEVARLQALPPSQEAVKATDDLTKHIEEATNRLGKLNKVHPCLAALRDINRNLFRLVNVQRELGGMEPLPEGDLVDWESLW